MYNYGLARYVKFSNLLEQYQDDPSEAKSILAYLLIQIKNWFENVYHQATSIFVGTWAWNSFKLHFGDLIVSDAFFWLPTFWLISFTLGSMWAFRESRWERKKAIKSVWKLIGYYGILVICHGMRKFTCIGGWPASLIEVATIFIEAYNALENAAGLTDSSWLKRLIKTSKVRVEDELNRLVGMVENQAAQHQQLASEVKEVKEIVSTVASSPSVSVTAENVVVQVPGKDEVKVEIPVKPHCPLGL